MKDNLIVSLVIAGLIGFSVASFMDNREKSSKLDELKKQNVELIKTKNMYAGLNDRQKAIILEYKRLSGIEVTTVTKNLDNAKKAKELEEKVKDILEGWE
jgi:hypothetical protein